MCPDCNKAYIEQTWRCFSTHYNTHNRAFHSNSHTSNFAKQLHDEAHSFDPHQHHHASVTSPKKEAHLNTIERFNIHIQYATSNHLNDDHTIFPNKIFDALIKTKQLPPHTPKAPLTQTLNTYPFLTKKKSHFKLKKHMISMFQYSLFNLLAPELFFKF